MNKSSANYDDLMRQKEKRKIDKAVQDAKVWWKSLDASQREAGFAAWKYRITACVLIRVPVPFCGFVDVVYYGMAGSKKERKEPTENQINSLREIVRKRGDENTIVEVAVDCVRIICKPQALKTDELSTTGDRFHGFITVA